MPFKAAMQTNGVSPGIEKENVSSIPPVGHKIGVPFTR